MTDMDLWLKTMTPSMDKAEPEGRLERWSVANFAKLDPAMRKTCVDRLLVALREPKSRSALVVWAYQLGRGLTLGSDDSRFHLGLGMQIRNWLRGAVRDDKLTPVEQPGGDFAMNWDDYYYGALRAAVEEEVLHGHEQRPER